MVHTARFRGKDRVAVSCIFQRVVEISSLPKSQSKHSLISLTIAAKGPRTRVLRAHERGLMIEAPLTEERDAGTEPSAEERMAKTGQRHIDGWPAAEDSR
jgi:hypothetical protein